MQDLLQELKQTAQTQRDLMGLIREETQVMDLNSVREIKEYCQLILELEVKRQTITNILAKIK